MSDNVVPFPMLQRDDGILSDVERCDLLLSRDMLATFGVIVSEPTVIDNDCEYLTLAGPRGELAHVWRERGARSFIVAVEDRLNSFITVPNLREGIWAAARCIVGPG